MYLVWRHVDRHSIADAKECVGVVEGDDYRVIRDVVQKLRESDPEAATRHGFNSFWYEEVRVIDPYRFNPSDYLA